MNLIKNIRPLYFNEYILKGCMRSVFYSPSDTDSLCRLIDKIFEVGDKMVKGKNNLIADLGCGSCIPTIFLAEKLRNRNVDFEINAFDIDEDAITVSKRNIKKMNLNSGINSEKKDIFSFLKESPNCIVNLIVSNPPYIPTSRNSNFKRLICVDGGEFGTKYIIPIIRYPKVKYIAIQMGSISDPEEFLKEVFNNGFNIRHMNIIETKFGLYTRKKHIKKHLKKLKENKKSYFCGSKYLILGFILEKSKKTGEEESIKKELIKFLESYSKNGLKNAYNPKVPFKMDFMRYKNTL